MNRRNRMILILTGVVLLTISILFISYGFISSLVTGSETAKRVLVKSTSLNIEYSDGSETLQSNGSSFIPGSSFSKNFTITNTGNTNLTYNISLTDIVNSFIRVQDLNYSLYLGSTLISSGQFPVDKLYVCYNQVLEVGKTNEYRLVINYLTSDENQIEDSGKTISAKLSFEENPTIIKSLKIYGNTIQNNNLLKVFDSGFSGSQGIAFTFDGINLILSGQLNFYADLATTNFYDATRSNYLNSLEIGKLYKISGYPSEYGSIGRIVIKIVNSNGDIRYIYENGNGTFFSLETGEYISTISVEINQSIAISNLVVKPLLVKMPTPDVPIQFTNLGDNSKNLFDAEKIANETSYPNRIYITQDKKWLRLNDGPVYTTINFNAKENTQYTFSGIVKAETSDPTAIVFRAYYTDGTSSDLIRMYLNDVNEHSFSGTTISGKTISYIKTDNYYNKYYLLKIGDTQIEKNTIATTQVPNKYIDVVYNGKNLFGNFNSGTEFKNLDIFITGDYGTPVYWTNGLTFSNSTIKITGVNSKLSIRFGNLKPNTTYSFSCRSTPFSGRIYAFFGNSFYYSNSGRYNYTFFTDVNGDFYITSDKNYFMVASGYITIPPEGIILSEFQIEEGDTVTTYEKYQKPVKTTIDLIGHEPLKCVNNICDYIDYNSSSIVRKVGEIVLDGTEKAVTMSENSFYYDMTGLNSSLEYHNVMSTHSLGEPDNNSISPTVYLSNDNKLIFSGWQSMYSNATLFNSFLQSENTAGRSLTIYYPLNETTNEHIDLPTILTLKDNVSVHVHDQLITSSDFEVEYID